MKIAMVSEHANPLATPGRRREASTRAGRTCTSPPSPARWPSEAIG